MMTTNLNHEDDENEDENSNPSITSLFMDKVVKETISRLKDDLKNLLKFLARLWIEIKIVVQLIVEFINEYLDTLLQPSEIVRLLQSQDEKLGTKTKKKTINAHIVKTMNKLINTVKNMTTEQQPHSEQTPNRLYVLDSNASTIRN